MICAFVPVPCPAGFQNKLHPKHHFHACHQLYNSQQPTANNHSKFTPKYIAASDSNRAFLHFLSKHNAETIDHLISSYATNTISALELTLLSEFTYYENTTNIQNEITVPRSVLILCRASMAGLIGVRIAQILSTKHKDKFELISLMVHDDKHSSAFNAQSEQHYVSKTFERLLHESTSQEYGIGVMKSLPSTFEFYYELIIDAFGTSLSEQHNEMQSQTLDSVVQALSVTERVVASLDVPLQWDSDSGPKPDDVLRDVFMKPDLLVSLQVPKRCARFFEGAFHYVVGAKHMHKELEQFAVDSLDEDRQCVAVKHDVKSLYWGRDPGEVYSSSSGFMATVAQNRRRRRWVALDDDDDLVDELD